MLRVERRRKRKMMTVNTDVTSFSGRFMISESAELFSRGGDVDVHGKEKYKSP